MQQLAWTGRVPDILPEATVSTILCDARNEWLSQPEQVQARKDFPACWNSDKRRRTMASRFRAMLKDKYGGVLWFQVLISTGSIPHRMLELANVQLGQKTLEQNEAAASSRGPRPPASPLDLSTASARRSGSATKPRS